MAGQLNCSITDGGGRDTGGAEQQHDDHELHPLSGSGQAEFLHAGAVRVLQALEELGQLAQPVGARTTRSTSSSWSASTNWAWVMASPSSLRDHNASRWRCRWLVVTALRTSATTNCE